MYNYTPENTCTLYNNNICMKSGSSLTNMPYAYDGVIKGIITVAHKCHPVLVGHRRIMDRCSCRSRQQTAICPILSQQTWVFVKWYIEGSCQFAIVPILSISRNFHLCLYSSIYYCILALTCGYTHPRLCYIYFCTVIQQSITCESCTCEDMQCICLIHYMGDDDKSCTGKYLTL